MQEWYQSRALYETVSKLITRGDFANAFEIAQSIPDKGIRAKSLSMVTVEMAKQRMDYKEALEKTIEAIMEIENYENVTKALMSLAFEFLALKRFDEALRIAEFIKDVSNRSKIQAEVGLALAREGKIHEAFKIINDILDDDVKTWATSKLASELKRG
ncbi:hypothetical protein K1720_02705 [Thermococcus argininiproducens]|uniref:Tetratricopeptide repeat protein n=1 Tax=Thermococcus argininiproducens TaxID=2866384 RepID=A0A9E7MBW2_9EURY|nr:hypothetical protein [Thermococcus argininiproducens]USH00397.1 hypothetical protein K1720_02705 [Thermococcus argininiproducens]